jgi:hypothetical protein
MKLAFIDTETTSLDPLKAEVIDFAAIIVDGMNGEVLEIFHTKIAPEHIEDAEPKALEINGYAANPEAWALAPKMGAIGPHIVGLLKGCTIVGHNVSFDENMLNSHFKRSGVEGKIPYHKIDTVTLAYEHLVPLGLKRVSLDSIREFMGWSKSGAHTALQDAQDAKRLFDLTWGMGTFHKVFLWFRVRFKTLIRGKW